MDSHTLLTEEKGARRLDSSADGLGLALGPSPQSSVIDVCASDTSSLWAAGPCPAASLAASGGSSP